MAYRVSDTIQNNNEAERVSRQKKKNTVSVILCIIVFIGIIVYIVYPSCSICGKKTKETVKAGNAEYPMCEEDQIKYGFLKDSETSVPSTSGITARVTTNEQSSGETSSATSRSSESNTKEYYADRPYYGMDERYINSTKIGTYFYKDFTVTLEGSGNAYTFLIDSRHALYVKTANGIVVMIQYIEDGKKFYGQKQAQDSMIGSVDCLALNIYYY